MSTTALKVVENATCTFCGCVCDDIELTVAGRPATLEEGVERAARILASARYPVVYGLSDTTCEAQRVAVGLADRIGACVDTTTSVCHGPYGMAFQGVGEVTCTLGEVKNRADLVVFWGRNPVESHP